jgi:dUTP pyrophosphatase
MTHLLKIRISDDDTTNPFDQQFLFSYYKDKVGKIGYDRDCGVDLVMPSDMTVATNQVTKINLRIECEFIPATSTESGPFWLVPRSSIANTPLQLANSIGIFDPEYRGPVIAAVRCLVDRNHQSTMDESKFHIKKGERLFQIISPDGQPIRVEVVDTLTPTKRGAGGFGSTNNKI